MTTRSETIDETAKALAWLFKALVNWGDIVTLQHIQNRGGQPWSVNDQLAHAHSELAEVFQAIRHKEEPYRAFEENLDAILSATTNLTIMRLNFDISKEVMNNYIDTLSLHITKKLYKRVGIAIE